MGISRWINGRVLLKYLAVKNRRLARNIRWELRVTIAVWGIELAGLWGKPVVFQRNYSITSKYLIWLFTTLTMALYYTEYFSGHHQFSKFLFQLLYDSISAHCSFSRLSILSASKNNSFSLFWKIEKFFAPSSHTKELSDFSNQFIESSVVILYYV